MITYQDGGFEDFGLFIAGFYLKSVNGQKTKRNRGG